MEMMRRRNAQVVIEYAVLIMAIVAGLLAVSIYVTRAKKGQLRKSAESLGEAYSLLHTKERKVMRSTFLNDTGAISTAADGDAAILSHRGGEFDAEYSRTDNLKHQANVVGGGTVEITEAMKPETMFDSSVSTITKGIEDIPSDFEITMSGAANETVLLNQTEQPVYE